MSLSNTSENEISTWMATGTAPAWASATTYIRLYSSDPGESGTATTNEVSYTGYDGVAMAKPAAWSVSGNTRSNAALIQFPLCSGGSVTATHWGECSTQNGAGTLILSGTLTSSLAISTGIQPQFNAGEIDIVID